jgi:hypothetical protein
LAENTAKRSSGGIPGHPWQVPHLEVQAPGRLDAARVSPPFGVERCGSARSHSRRHWRALWKQRRGACRRKWRSCLPRDVSVQLGGQGIHADLCEQLVRGVIMTHVMAKATCHLARVESESVILIHPASETILTRLNSPSRQMDVCSFSFPVTPPRFSVHCG